MPGILPRLLYIFFSPPPVPYVVSLHVLCNQPFSPWILSKCEKTQPQRDAGWVLRIKGLQKYIYISTLELVHMRQYLNMTLCVFVRVCVCACVGGWARAYKVTRLIVCGLTALRGAVVSCWWMSVSVRSMKQPTWVINWNTHTHRHQDSSLPFTRANRHVLKILQ